MSTVSRRAWLLGSAAALVAACARAETATEAKFKGSPFRKMTDGEWKARLSPKSYQILRHEATEVGGSGPFIYEKRKGVYHCMGCDLALFKSEWKYDHDDWPTFSNVMLDNIATKLDADGERTEYHCARCLGHMGHRFNDGPRPLGLRYCNNGYALTFKPG